LSSHTAVGRANPSATETCVIYDDRMWLCVLADRIEKEKNQMKTELEDLHAQIDQVTKAKVRTKSPRCHKQMQTLIILVVV